MEDKAGLQRITLSTPYSNTYLRMGAPNADHELILHTGDNALLDAKKNWDVIVGVNLDEHVIGNVKETYDRDKGEWVGGSAVETYTRDQTTTVGGKRASDYGSQTTYVRGSVDETYVSQKTSIGATLSVDANGAITIHSNTSISLDAPKVHVGGTAHTFKETPHSEEVYGYKNSMGNEKLDACHLSISLNSLKLELTDAAIARTGIKLDSVGFKITHGGFKANIGPEATKAPLNLWSIGCSVMTCGLAKLG
jgi:hypothetical protein